MPTKSFESLHLETQPLFSEEFGARDQSGSLGRTWTVLESGKDSLAVFQHPILLKRQILEFSGYLVSVSFEGFLAEIDCWLQEYPSLVLVKVYNLRQEVDKSTQVECQEKEQLAARLQDAFEADPLEDGMCHPAEEVIAGALQSTDEQYVLGWLKTFSLDTEHPNFAASVLRCLGRQVRPGSIQWRVEMVRAGLAMQDVEIRDAAVQAAESWADSEMRDILQAHSDPEPWLRNYIQDVVEDLGE